MANRTWKMSGAVVAVASALFLPTVASKAQTASPNPQELPIKCDPRTGNLIGFDLLVKPNGASGLPNFNLMVKGRQGRAYDFAITPLTKEDKETLVGRQSAVNAIIDAAIEAAKNSCRAKIAKEGQETFRPNQTPVFASRSQHPGLFGENTISINAVPSRL